MKYYIKTYGCQMNYSDSQRIATILNDLGYSQAKTHTDADLIIVNTCSVRQKSEEKVIGWVNQITKNYPKKLIVVTGCMSQRDFKLNSCNNTQIYLKELHRKFQKSPNVIFIETKNISNLPIFLKQRQSRGKKNLYYYPTKLNTPEYLNIPQTFDRQNGITAYIPITTGCNQFCSYCIVPFSRGEEYYISKDKIIKEIKNALENNKKHIILVGQIVDKWRENSNTFDDLLKDVCAIDGDFWVSFLSSHPNYMSTKTLDFIIENPKMMKFLGLPLQSGSNKILSLMNRGYTIEQYLEKINYLKDKFKHFYSKKQDYYNYLYLTTDIIVGFSNETENDFKETYKIINEVKFNKVFVASYSVRSYSPASKTLEDNISLQEKKKRNKILVELNQKIYEDINKSLVGKNILVKPINTRNGYTYSNQFIELEKIPTSMVGKTILVSITDGNRYGIKGKMISDRF